MSIPGAQASGTSGAVPGSSPSPAVRPDSVAHSSLPPRPRHRSGPSGLLLALALLLPASAPAQVPAEPVLEGRVLRGSEPLGVGTVVLHRVSGREGGSVDSVAVGPEGGFRFELPDVPRETDPLVYFASVRHQGVLYFGSAVNRAVQLDSVYRIQVYDTISAPPGGAAFQVSARNVLMETAEGRWSAVDLLQIRNEGDRTVVGRDGGVVWRYPLPPEAEDFRVGRSDLAPDAVSFEDGSVRVGGPVPPGERTYLVRYSLPELSFTLPMPGTTGRFELLVREPAPEITVAGATRVDPVEMEPGSSYRRYSATDVRNHVVEVSQGPEGMNVPVSWLAVGLALVLAVAGIVAVRHRPAPAAVAAADSPATREELLLRIAELDEAHRRLDDPGPEERQRYRTQRSRLKARLRELE